MRKTLHKFFLGVVAASTLATLTVVNAADRADMNQPGDLDLDITEDISDSNVLSDADLELPIPEIPVDAASDALPQAESVPAAVEAPGLDAPVALAQTPATNVATPGDSNVLDEPITAVQAPEIPDIEAPVTVVQAPETPVVDEPGTVPETPAENATRDLPLLPPAESSILNDSAVPAQTIIPQATVPRQAAVPQQSGAVMMDPVQIPYGGTRVAKVNGGMTRVGPARPMMRGGSCPDCQQPTGTLRPIYYGVQRNGVHAYPRAGNCDGCCNGPMPYPYYTLRGPRDFDDPNPRPIGP